MNGVFTQSGAKRSISSFGVLESRDSSVEFILSVLEGPQNDIATQCRGEENPITENSFEFWKDFLRHEFQCAPYVVHRDATEVDHADDVSDADLFVFP